jgi:hypothetical protein
VTHGERPYLYPQWSPDGKRSRSSGINENRRHHTRAGRPPVPPKPLNWRYDDLRPVWSPDGKRRFYTNYNLPTISRPGHRGRCRRRFRPDGARAGGTGGGDRRDPGHRARAGVDADNRRIVVRNEVRPQPDLSPMP